jgi:hypothetical protein
LKRERFPLFIPKRDAPNFTPFLPDRLLGYFMTGEFLKARNGREHQTVKKFPKQLQNQVHGMVTFTFKKSF